MKKNFYIYPDGRVNTYKLNSNCHKFLANAYTLCFARHPMVVDDYIFPTKVNPFDFKALERIATAKLKKCTSDHPVVVYITGLKSAMLAVVNVCKKLNLPLVFIHYNSKYDRYDQPQLMGDFHLTDFDE